MMKLNHNQHHELRREVRKFYRGAEIDLHVARQAIIDMMNKGEVKLTTFIPFINHLVDEMISSVTIADMERNGEETRLNFQTIKQATKTYLLSYSMRRCR